VCAKYSWKIEALERFCGGENAWKSTLILVLMPSRSFGLVFVMGSLFDKLRIYFEKLNQSEAEESKIGAKTAGTYSPKDFIN
jgi:hypothetical protein